MFWSDPSTIEFEAERSRITWREVRDVQRGMRVYHGESPNTLLMGRRVRFSLWDRLVCRVFLRVKVRRSG